jgi:N-acetylneuraminic acid mutarotase
MVYDSKGGEIVLFGGTAGRWVGSIYQGGFNDLWSYDPAANAWTQLPTTGEVPSARSGAGLVYDSAASKLILFGGSAEYVEESPEPYTLNDLWAYDPVAGTWTELHPTGKVPSARWLFGMAYDPACCLTILFGGSVMDADLPYPETLWAYDSAANAWKKLQPAGRFPYGRQGPAMVYDPTIGGLVMFGGFNVANGHLSGTWTLTP